MKLENKKAGVGEMVLFLFSMFFVSIVIFYVMGSDATNAAITDVDETSIGRESLADAIVNTKDCLLYTTPITVSTTPLFKADRGIIDCNKVDTATKRTLLKTCVAKGAFTWKAVIENFDSSSCEETIGESGCTDHFRKIPVILKDDSDYYKGKVDVYICGSEYPYESVTSEVSEEDFGGTFELKSGYNYIVWPAIANPNDPYSAADLCCTDENNPLCIGFHDSNTVYDFVESETGIGYPCFAPSSMDFDLITGEVYGIYVKNDITLEVT